MFILYGTSGILLLWMAFRWTIHNLKETFLKFLFFITGQLNLIMMFKELGVL